MKTIEEIEEEGLHELADELVGEMSEKIKKHYSLTNLPKTDVSGAHQGILDMSANEFFSEARFARYGTGKSNPHRKRILNRLPAYVRDEDTGILSVREILERLERINLTRYSHNRLGEKSWSILSTVLDEVGIKLRPYEKIRGLSAKEAYYKGWR